MHGFYFLAEQVVANLQLRIKFVSLIRDTLLNNLELAIDDFEVLEVLLVRYHYILKSVNDTDRDVVPFIRA